MAKLPAVIAREYMERVLTKWFVIATLGGPIVLGAMMILPAMLSRQRTAAQDVSNIAILDATGTELGKRIAANLTGPAGDTARVQVRAVAPPALAEAESLATREVVAKTIRGYLVVDEATLRGIDSRYSGRNATAVADMERIRSAVEAGLLARRLEEVGVAPGDVRRVTAARPKMRTERITDRGRGGSGELSIYFALAVAFLLYMLIVLYGQTILRGVMEEKQSRVAEVVVASVRPETLLAGKVIGVGAVALTQMALWALVTWVVVQLREPIMQRLGLPAMPLALPSISLGMWVSIILFFVFGFIFYSSLFAAVGSTVASDQDAQQASTPVVLLVILSAVFIQPVLLNPTSPSSLLMSRLPFSAPILMPIRMSLVPVSWAELALVIAGMVAACVAAVWVAARIYRVGLLMYGKRPTVGEIMRWVRQA